MTEPVWVYRTEVENTLEVPIRVIWFQFSFRDEHGTWFGTNVRKRELFNEDFRDWYGDEPGIDEKGWLAPGAKGVCDPNWQLAFCEEIGTTKWGFIAVDAEGNDYYAEAIVPQEVCVRYDPNAKGEG